MNDKPTPQWAVWFGGMMFGFGLTMFSGTVYTFFHEPAMFSTLGLTAKQRKEPILINMPPTTVTITFLTKENFDEAVKDGHNVYAFTHPFEHPCHIYMQADRTEITALPDVIHSAHFTDEFVAETVAHELLHCIYWDWHR